MSKVKQTKKTPYGVGEQHAKYEFSCTRSNGTASAPIILDFSNNDDQAKALAQLECDLICGEAFRNGAKTDT